MSSLIKNVKNESGIADCGDAAFGYFSELYCAESVLRAVSEAEGVVSELIPRIATGFCSGMARTGGLCGAVAGGIMAISLVHGRDCGDDSVQPTYDRVVVLRKAVEEVWGSINCHALTACDFNTPEGQERFRQGGIKETVCREVARDCAAFALWLIRTDLAVIQAASDTRPELLR